MIQTFVLSAILLEILLFYVEDVAYCHCGIQFLSCLHVVDEKRLEHTKTDEHWDCLKVSIDANCE
jgi:hypothetical protein